MRHIRSLLFSVFMFIASLSFAAEENAHKELIFITSEYCPFCEAWEQDIGSLYHRTTYAKQAPLRRIDITEVEFELLRHNQSKIIFHECLKPEMKDFC